MLLQSNGNEDRKIENHTDTAIFPKTYSGKGSKVSRIRLSKDVDITSMQIQTSDYFCLLY